MNAREFSKENSFPYSDDVIMEFIGGSQLHGAKLQGTDDTDLYGVFIEPPTKALGTDSYEHFVFSTGGKEGGNKPSDTDVCLYSLRKWAGLVCKGNPSVLHFLFAKPTYETLEWSRLTFKKTPFLAKSHLNAFFGYANAQLRRLYNGRGPKDVSRPFLEEQFGYDTKYAMHIIRLLDEARELMEDGKITLPRPNADFLREIREGKVKLYEIEKLSDDLQIKAKAAQQKSDLPERPDRKKISELVAECYLMNWERKKLWNTNSMSFRLPESL